MGYVILIAAKNLACDGRMLHSIQHDNSPISYFRKDSYETTNE